MVLGLGDPAGADSDRISAVWRLRDLARQEGSALAFWRVRRGQLKVYADLGLTAVPLGADGLPCDRHDPAAGRAEEFLVCHTERDLLRLLPALAQAGRGPVGQREDLG